MLKSDPFQAELTNGTDNRNALAVSNVVKQFEAELLNPDGRYTKDANGTYCNIFVWDVTRALACEIPHWWQGREVTANGNVLWLGKYGPDYGWHACTKDAAKSAVADGQPVVATYYNPVGHGHIAFCYQGDTGMVVAQAGIHNFIGGHIDDAFGELPVVFYVHD